MTGNLKTLGFFVLIAIMCSVPFLNKKINKGREVVHEESGNARELYTGRTRDVYNPLDKAYVVSEKLRELIKQEDQLNFLKYKLWPVVSLWVDPKDLEDENRGAFANPKMKGRLWERATYLNYYEKGVKRFSSFAGLRVHGGASRTRPNKSLRIYFRKAYGEESFLTDVGIGLKEGSPIKRLLLRRDTHYNFSNDLSYSMIKKMGGIAPNIKHVAVYLNGKFFQYMQMVEHLHEDQVKHFIGHERFLFYKLKGNNPTKDRLLYESAIHRINGASSPIDFNKQARVFDLENVTANMLTIAYLGMIDWAQGVWIKDQSLQESKWKLISWDFDYAFADSELLKGKISKFPPWKKDGFDVAMKMHIASLRSRLFNRLIKESPEYQDFFLQKVDRMFDEELTDDFFVQKFTHYEALAKEVNNNAQMLKSIQGMRDFVKHRKPFFCQQMLRTLSKQANTCSKLTTAD